MNIRYERDAYLTPLVVGVTGHRDLVEAEFERLENHVEQFFAELKSRFPNSPVRLLSSLAEGADRLVARVALRNDVQLQVVLPMPAREYCDDFKTPESIAEFEDLCSKAEILELPVVTDENDAESVVGQDRDMAYANAGMFISAHCHILLALWDGKQTHHVGGTAQIVYFQHYDRLPGLAESVPRTSLFLTDDESDLVYHIPCLRQRSLAEYGEAAPLADPTWYTADPELPNLHDLPNRYVHIFRRTDEFNRDVERYLDNRDAPLDSLTSPPETGTSAAAERIGRSFSIADALADYFQTRIQFTLRATHVLAVLAGLAFILYSEVDRFDFLIFAFLIILVGGMAVVQAAQRRDWHRKYLDYRVLAEGLRVQYFWTIAGIHGDGQTKFAYDNFLRQRDMELGWIRNIMRVAGTLGDSMPHSFDAAGLNFAIDHWIGDDQHEGQLSYYRDKSAQRSRNNRITDRLALFCFWGGILIAFVLAFFLDAIGLTARTPLLVLMGALPLTAAVAETYTQRKANRELSKQYEFMEHVFNNARRRLDEAVDNNERNEVLQGLGEAALTEHAEWILIHRDRKPETSY
jgi:hypothetical protein